MKLFTVRKWIYVFIAVTFFACKDSGSEKRFEISGTVTNAKDKKKIYLEELPAGSSQGIIVDSSILDAKGGYKLKAGSKESGFYTILIDQNEYPLVSVINDVPKVSVDIELSNQDARFAEKSDVKGSPATDAMRNYISTIDGDLQRIYLISREADSLRKLNVADSLMMPLMTEWRTIGEKIKDYSFASFNKANDPALLIFELGYYQRLAERFGIEPLNPEEELAVVTKASEKFPGHSGLLEIRKNRDENVARYKKMTELKWVGKQAPDFSLPDASGKEVKLSSFRGKYLLVDFWASWCVPCRQENPNVVKAFNRFKGKNFAILGVSLDNPGEKDRWLSAVKKDNLTWTQVSDLKGWESIVVPLYDFGQVGIPYNILLDPEGVVIGERLKGAALEAKLEEVLR